MDASANYCHEPAANTQAVVTMAAPGGQHRNVIAGVYWSYDGNPTGGGLQITANGVQMFEVDITTGGPGFLPFDPPLQFPRGQAVIVALAPGGLLISGIVNVHGWVE